MRGQAMYSRSLFILFMTALSMTTRSCSGPEETCVRHVEVPAYPPLARMARLQGTVKIRVGIGMDGVVTSAKASRARKLLEAAAEENIRRWTFALGTESSVSRQAVITFVYRLEGKE